MTNPQWNLPDLDAAISDALHAGAEVLREKSDARAPQDTGAMIASAAIAVDGDAAAVYYVSPYAVKQHEALGLKHVGGGEAKFLEKAASEDARAIGDAVAAVLRARLDGGSA